MRGDVPWQRLFDAIDRMVGDAPEHITQIGFWVQAAEFGRSDQAVEGGSALATGIGSSE